MITPSSRRAENTLATRRPQPRGRCALYIRIGSGCRKAGKTADATGNDVAVSSGRTAGRRGGARTACAFQRVEARPFSVHIHGETTMPRGEKSAYTDKQKRKAEHIEEGYETKGVSSDEAERRAWATVNKQDGGGKQSGSGRKN